MNQVTPADLLAYIQANRQDDEDVDLDSISDYFLFEAVSEKIVELNPELRVEQMAKSYKESDVDMSTFARQQLDQVLHTDCYTYLSDEELDKWVEYSVNGMQTNLDD